jgi:L-amino acid N-acyltransferase YncA
MDLKIEAMIEADWPEVAAIYAEGIATGHATFASEPPESFATWNGSRLPEHSRVARDATGVIFGWVCLSKVSDRCVYAGVAEHSIYVAAAARGRGVGHALMRALIAGSEAAGIWTLQSGIFPENTASLALHQRHGFRVVGRRERVGRMSFGPLAGKWRDTLLVERRSAITGVD